MLCWDRFVQTSLRRLKIYNGLLIHIVMNSLLALVWITGAVLFRVARCAGALLAPWHPIGTLRVLGRAGLVLAWRGTRVVGGAMLDPVWFPPVSPGGGKVHSP